MKKHLLLLAFALLFPFLNRLTAQSSCLPNGITFTSQAQIDGFPVNYPGCMVIEGDVEIKDGVNDDITSVDSLYNIVSIKGSLIVLGNENLMSLGGLESIDSIYGGVRIQGNTVLSSLSGLDNLEFIGIQIAGPPTPSSIPTYGLAILFNNSLVSLNEINSLQTIVGPVRIEGNHNLISLSGLDNISQLAGLSIEDHLSLTSISSLGNLQSIEGPLIVSSNVALESLEGLENLQSIEGCLLISKNDVLASLQGLSQLTSVGKTGFTSGFGKIWWEHSLTISENPTLTSVNGLELLDSIEGCIKIEKNDLLNDLTGLQNLTSGIGNCESGDTFGGSEISSLIISENPTLTSCEIQPFCLHLENGGETTIENNALGCNTQQEVEDACGIMSSVDGLIIIDGIQLFPNPTTGIIQFTAPDNTEWKVQVRDARGKTVIQPHQLTNGEINLSAVPNGLYFLELNNNQKTSTHRIIKY